ncbi:hypothetical protein B0J11DRAFT_587000 [Dendryphion nanum]|uniref:Uncharacterized protein n=1 Tax=Dendryphion nanum TaxID=256645 RepID=A0A9P9J0T2_9PLEO|nr:hypothetical protein B0J11DRAFT_587000 [Dendryphion nanum]
MEPLDEHPIESKAAELDKPSSPPVDSSDEHPQEIDCDTSQMMAVPALSSPPDSSQSVRPPAPPLASSPSFVGSSTGVSNRFSVSTGAPEDYYRPFIPLSRAALSADRVGTEPSRLADGGNNTNLPQSHESRDNQTRPTVPALGSPIQFQSRQGRRARRPSISLSRAALSADRDGTEPSTLADDGNNTNLPRSHRPRNRQIRPVIPNLDSIFDEPHQRFREASVIGPPIDLEYQRQNSGRFIPSMERSGRTSRASIVTTGSHGHSAREPDQDALPASVRNMINPSLDAPEFITYSQEFDPFSNVQPRGISRLSNVSSLSGSRPGSRNNSQPPRHSRPSGQDSNGPRSRSRYRFEEPGAGIDPKSNPQNISRSETRSLTSTSRLVTSQSVVNLRAPQETRGAAPASGNNYPPNWIQSSQDRGPNHQRRGQTTSDMRRRRRSRSREYTTPRGAPAVPEIPPQYRDAVAVPVAVPVAAPVAAPVRDRAIPHIPIEHLASSRRSRASLDRMRRDGHSSRSSNRPTDSEGPSSDSPFPSTPNDGSAVDLPVRVTGGDSDPITANNGSDVLIHPGYMDYSEEFDNKLSVRSTQHATSPPAHPKSDTQTRIVSSARSGPQILVPLALSTAAYHECIAELAATPVGKPLTRKRVKEGIGSPSTTGLEDLSGIKIEELDGKRGHTPKSSDQQSFTTCPNLSEPRPSFKSSRANFTPVLRHGAKSVPNLKSGKPGSSTEQPLLESQSISSVLDSSMTGAIVDSSPAQSVPHTGDNVLLTTVIPSQKTGLAKDVHRIGQKVKNFCAKLKPKFPSKRSKGTTIDNSGLQTIQNLPDDSEETTTNPDMTINIQSGDLDDSGVSSNQGQLAQDYVFPGPDMRGDQTSSHNLDVMRVALPPTPLLDLAVLYPYDNFSSLLTRYVQLRTEESHISAEYHVRDSQSTTYLSWSLAPKTFALGEQAILNNARMSQGYGREDTTTDLRLSAYAKKQYLSHELPDLKEESHEDSSLNTSASNLKYTSHKYPFEPQLCTRGSVDGIALLGRTASVNSGPRSSLIRCRRLPSMNFSRMDLISSLKHALRRSLELPGTIDGEQGGNIHSLEPRPTSSQGLNAKFNEKFRSIIAGLEDVEQEFERTGNAPDLSTIQKLLPSHRSTADEDVLADLENLTIPSVGGLTQRFSEWLPKLYERLEPCEEGEFEDEETIMEHAMEQLQAFAGPGQKRSSARLRPMPGSPQLVVVDDDVYEELTGREKKSVDEVEDTSVGRGSLGDGSFAQDATTSSESTSNIAVAELEAPIPPSALRLRSQSMCNQDRRSIVESRLSSKSLRSVLSTPTATATDSRPWNSDKNYPWALDNIPSIDISLPSPSPVQASPRPGPSALRYRVSDSFETGATLPASASLSPVTVSVPASSGFHSQSLSGFGAFSPTEQRDLISVGLGTTGSLHLHAHRTHHEAGERYPTSSLTSPTFINPDEMGSTHSRLSDGSDENQGEQKRRRFRNLLRRSANNAAVTAPQSQTEYERELRAMTGRSIVSNLSVASDVSVISSDSQDVYVHGPWTERFDEAGLPVKQSRAVSRNDAIGMSRNVYHRQRFLNAFRKFWYRSVAKSGQILRSLSQRKQNCVQNTNSSLSAQEGRQIVMDARRPQSAEDSISRRQRSTGRELRPLAVEKNLDEEVEEKKRRRWIRNPFSRRRYTRL